VTFAHERNYALIINPSAGSGRALKLLPEVERELDARRMVFRVERTRSTAHGIDIAIFPAVRLLQPNSCNRAHGWCPEVAVNEWLLLRIRQSSFGGVTEINSFSADHAA